MATLKIRCTNTQVKGSVKVSTEPNIVTFHIYNRGSIEKHIPKKITQGYENKYRYVYHIGNKEYEICILEWFSTTKMASGNIPIQDKTIELIDIRNFRGYKSVYLNIRFRTINSPSGRYYIAPVCLASLIGAMGVLNIDDLGFNGFSDKLGRSVGGSKSHLNGVCGDLRYLSIKKDGGPTLLGDAHFDYERQMKFCEALFSFGWAADGKRKMLSERFSLNKETVLLPHCTHYARGSVRHHHHLHLQGFNPSICKNVTE